MTKIKEMRALTVEELQEQQKTLAKEIYQMNCELKLSRKLEKPHFVREKKRARARLLTLIREKQEAAR